MPRSVRTAAATAANRAERMRMPCRRAVLTAVGFDVLLFDYRGYGRSSGRPGEQGTYRDARAALVSRGDHD